MRNLEWYHAHKVIVAERTKLYRERNDDKLRANKRVYHEKNAEVVRAKVRAWQKANPLKRRAQIHKRMSLQRRVPFDWTDTDASSALLYWKHCCAACRSKRQLCWDHWIPLAASECPGTVPLNMVPLCLLCNSQKQDRPAIKWLRERFGSKADDIARRVVGYLASVRKGVTVL